MSPPPDLRADWHTHTSTPDGAASAEQMVEAADAVGRHRLHLVLPGAGMAAVGAWDPVAAAAAAVSP